MNFPLNASLSIIKITIMHMHIDIWFTLIECMINLGYIGTIRIVYDTHPFFRIIINSDYIMKKIIDFLSTKPKPILDRWCLYSKQKNYFIDPIKYSRLPNKRVLSRLNTSN